MRIIFLTLIILSFLMGCNSTPNERKDIKFPAELILNTELILKFPEADGATVSLSANNETTLHTGDYTNDFDRWTITLFSLQMTGISKVGDIKNENYFTVPFTLSNQG